VPKLWTDTIETHRREVRDAVIDTTAALIAEDGLLAVTMSRIAEQTGIGRATLYKYFPDVESILAAWHERQIAAHLEQLVEVQGRPGDPMQRLHAVLETYALIMNESRGHHDNELAAALHRDQHAHRAEHQLRHLVQGLLADAVKSGEIRDDIPTGELSTYCLHALSAASSLPSKTAVRRLVTLTLSGLRRG
jgi:AcrR family transcriptional regulator